MPRKTSTIPDDNTTGMIGEDTTPIVLTEEDKARDEAIDGLFQIGQFVAIAAGDLADAGAIGLHGPSLKREVVLLARENKFIASKVDLLVEVGPYAGVIAAGLPFVIQILCNHGILKAKDWGRAGVESKESLEIQMKTLILQREMAARQAQMAAEEQLARMREAMTEAANDDNPANNSESANVE